MTKRRLRESQILLVEDSPEDIELTREAMSENMDNINIHVVNDGINALGFLRRLKGFEAVPIPDLILLDLNLPKKDGRAVLSEIKTDDRLRKIPVIVLTTSSSHGDISACYDSHANCYITKPVDYDSFIQVAKSIEAFWFSIVRLPLLNV
jgi:two-component system response regulator